MNETTKLLIAIPLVIMGFLATCLLTDYVIFILGTDITYSQAILVTFWIGLVARGSTTK